MAVPNWVLEQTTLGNLALRTDKFIFGCHQTHASRLMGLQRAIAVDARGTERVNVDNN